MMVPRSSRGDPGLEKSHQCAGVSSGWSDSRLCLVFLLCNCWGLLAASPGQLLCEPCSVPGVPLASGFSCMLTQSLPAHFPTKPAW